MDEEIKLLFKALGLEINSFEELNGMMISRETLLSQNKYDEIKDFIPELKKNYSSSFMTSLQKNADKSQKWPLINLVRQILHVYGYNMIPIRKSNGYTLEGIKKFKRYFFIVNKNLNTKKIELNNNNKDNIH
jgi:hypothetical protein